MKIIAALFLALLCTLSHAQTYSLKIDSSGSSSQATANAWVEVSLVTTVPGGATVLYYGTSFVNGVDTSQNSLGWYSYSNTYYVSGVPPTMKIINPSDFSVVATISITGTQTSTTPVRIAASNTAGVIFRMADNTLVGSQWAGASGRYGVVALGGGTATGEYMGKDACGNNTQIYKGRYAEVYKFASNSSGCGYPVQNSVGLSVSYLLGY